MSTLSIQNFQLYDAILLEYAINKTLSIQQKKSLEEKNEIIKNGYQIHRYLLYNSMSLLFPKIPYHPDALGCILTRINGHTVTAHRILNRCIEDFCCSFLIQRKLQVQNMVILWLHVISEQALDHIINYFKVHRIAGRIFKSNRIHQGIRQLNSHKKRVKNEDGCIILFSQTALSLEPDNYAMNCQQNHMYIDSTALTKRRFNCNGICISYERRNLVDMCHTGDDAAVATNHQNNSNENKNKLWPFGCNTTKEDDNKEGHLLPYEVRKKYNELLSGEYNDELNVAMMEGTHSSVLPLYEVNLTAILDDDDDDDASSSEVSFLSSDEFDEDSGDSDMSKKDEYDSSISQSMSQSFDILDKDKDKDTNKKKKEHEVHVHDHSRRDSKAKSKSKKDSISSISSRSKLSSKQKSTPKSKRDDKYSDDSSSSEQDSTLMTNSLHGLRLPSFSMDSRDDEIIIRRTETIFSHQNHLSRGVTREGSVVSDASDTICVGSAFNHLRSTLIYSSLLHKKHRRRNSTVQEKYQMSNDRLGLINQYGVLYLIICISQTVLDMVAPLTTHFMSEQSHIYDYALKHILNNSDKPTFNDSQYVLGLIDEVKSGYDLMGKLTKSAYLQLYSSKDLFIRNNIPSPFIEDITMNYELCQDIVGDLDRDIDGIERQVKIVEKKKYEFVKLLMSYSTAVINPLNFMASFFGMNFSYQMPLLRRAHGTAILLGSFSAIVVMVYAIFVYKGWLEVFVSLQDSGLYEAIGVSSGNRHQDITSGENNEVNEEEQVNAAVLQRTTVHNYNNDDKNSNSSDEEGEEKIPFSGHSNGKVNEISRAMETKPSDLKLIKPDNGVQLINIPLNFSNLYPHLPTLASSLSTSSTSLSSNIPPPDIDRLQSQMSCTNLDDEVSSCGTACAP